MPVYSFTCDCGTTDDRLADPGDEELCPRCGHAMRRLFSPTRNLRLAEYAKRENEDSRARHREWLDKPEVQAKLKSGEYDVDLSAREGSGEGEACSSSILTRLEAGLPVG